MSGAPDEPNLGRSDGIQRLRGHAYGGLFAVSALVSVLTTVAILLTLLSDAVNFFAAYPIEEFLTGTVWSPGNFGGGAEFGIVPLLIGTVVVTVVAGLVAIPVGTLTAVYLSEYASTRARAILKPMLEVLAGVPTVVYGYFALVYVTPALKATLFPSTSTFNALSASLMVGIMTIPMVSSISEDAMSAVPDELRQAGYGLGATKYDVSTGVVVPAALSGIVSSYVLALSRAVGETMIVVVAMGAQAEMPPVREALGVVPYLHPGDVLLEPGQTITVAMVQVAGGDLAGGSLAYDALFALGLALFVVTLAMNVVGDLVAERYREVY